MTVRFHLLMTEAQYRALTAEAERTGLPVAELARHAIEHVYRPDRRPRIGGVELSLGFWRRPDAAVAGRRPGIRLRD